MDNNMTTDATPNVIGKTLEEATLTLNQAGFTIRVLKEDGEQRMGTCDWIPTRVTLDLANGKVTAQSNG